MRLTVICALLVAALSVIPVVAQDTSADEKAIREAIAARDKGKAVVTDDMIFWSGALKQPQVGKEKPDLMPGVAERKPGGSSTTKVRRIEISKSGDMAYEFSDADVTVVEGSGQTRKFPASLLRVWKKVDGQWRIAAHFQRPHEQESAAAHDALAISTWPSQRTTRH